MSIIYDIRTKKHMSYDKIMTMLDDINNRNVQLT